MSVASWDYPLPFWLSSPVGTLNLNAEVVFSNGSGFYLLNPSACNTTIPLRSSDTNLPQKDGEQLHRRFYQGYQMTLAIQFWESLESPACDELLQEMYDDLMRHVRALTNPTDGRVYWTPSGLPDRMLKKVRLFESAAFSLEESGVTQVVFTVKSGYPYAWDSAEITSALPATLTNSGSADFWPVLKVFGATSAFTITNTSVLDSDGNPLAIEYDASQTGASSIGGGSYVEIDHFVETMYLNGDGANMKPGLVMADSDFFPLAVGDNTITISGATANVLWQNAYA